MELGRRVGRKSQERYPGQHLTTGSVWKRGIRRRIGELFFFFCSGRRVALRPQLTRTRSISWISTRTLPKFLGSRTMKLATWSRNSISFFSFCKRYHKRNDVRERERKKKKIRTLFFATALLKLNWWLPFLWSESNHVQCHLCSKNYSTWSHQNGRYAVSVSPSAPTPHIFTQTSHAMTQRSNDLSVRFLSLLRTTRKSKTFDILPQPQLLDSSSIHLHRGHVVQQRGT